MPCIGVEKMYEKRTSSPCAGSGATSSMRTYLAANQCGFLPWHYEAALASGQIFLKDQA